MQLLFSRNTGFQWITFSNVELFYCILLYQLLDLHICIANTGPLYLPCHKFRTVHTSYQKFLYLFVPHQNFCNCTSVVLQQAYTSSTSQVLNMYSLCIANFRLIYLSNFGHKCQICACTVCTLRYMQESELGVISSDCLIRKRKFDL